MSQTIVGPSEWRTAREALLVAEKAHMRAGDEIAARRRELPVTVLEKEYVFDGPDGQVSLAEMFEGRGQLATYHFMFHPDWTQGCHRCSFWADGYDGVDVHLARRDLTFVAISRAPYEKLAEYKQRMGWSFKWYSAYNTDFNQDMDVSFDKEEFEAGQASYNFGAIRPHFEEMQGLSMFVKLDDGRVGRAYSTYGRGIDAFSVGYQLLDLSPKGRDEQDLGFDPMVWIQRHDQYKD